MLKTTVFQSIAISSEGIPQHRHLAAMAEVGEHLAEGRGIARHFETHVETLGHAELLLDIGDALVPDVDGARRPERPREVEAPGIHIGDNDMPRPA